MNPDIDTYGLRYLTVAGAYVVIDRDIDAALHISDDHFGYDIPPQDITFDWRITCYGCGWSENNPWENPVRGNAQRHAETCRALPAAGHQPPQPQTFTEAVKATLDQQTAEACERFTGHSAGPYQDDHVLAYAPTPEEHRRFVEFIWRIAALWNAPIREPGSGVSAYRFRSRYEELTKGCSR
ncbi:MAG TPA: hypothetical protein VGL02_20555 [Streptomyces sp.]